MKKITTTTLYRKIVVFLCIVSMLGSILPLPTNASEQEDTYTEFTFSDFGLESKEYRPGEPGGFGTATSITSLEGVAISGKVKFNTPTASPATINYIRIGCNANHSGGIDICTSDDGGIRVAFLNGGADRPDLSAYETVVYTTIPGSNYIGKEVELRVAFKTKNGSPYMSISIDGAECYKGAIPTIAGLMTSVGVYSGNTPISIASIQDEDTYTEFTFSDFGLESKEYRPGEPGGFGTATSITSLEGVAISGKVKFNTPTASPATINYIRIGCNANHSGGIDICTSDDGGIRVAFLNGGADRPDLSAYETVVYTTIPGSNYIGKEVELRVAFKTKNGSPYMSISIDGAECYKGAIPTIAGLMTSVGVYSGNTPITISDVPKDTPDDIPENITYTELTFSDFGLESKEYRPGEPGAFGTTASVTSLEGVAISGKIKFNTPTASPATINYLRIGCNANHSGGIDICTSDDGGIRVAFLNGGADRPDLSAYETVVYTTIPGSNYIGKEVELRVAFKTKNGSQWMSISINGAECYKGAIPTIAGLMTSVGVYSGNTPITISDVPKDTPDDIPENITYTELTFSDFGLESKEYRPGEPGAFGTTASVTSLEGVAISGKIKFNTPTASPATINYLRIGCNANHSGGIDICTSDDGGIRVAFLNGGADRPDLSAYETVVYTTIPGSNYIGKEVELRVAFKTKNGSQWMSISIDGAECYKGAIPTITGLMTSVGVYSGNTPITISDVPKDTPDDIPENITYTELTFADFGVPSKEYKGDGTNFSQSLGIASGVKSLEGIAITGKVKFTTPVDANTQIFNGIRIGCDSNGSGGIDLHCTSNTIVLRNLSNPDNVQLVTIPDNNYIGNEVEMRFAFDTREGIPHLTFSINGKNWYNGAITAIENLGPRFYVFSKDTSLTITSIKTGNSGPVPTIDESFTQLKFDSFGIESGTYKYMDDTISAMGHCGLNSMDKVVFSDTVRFSKERGAQIHFAGQNPMWFGIIINTTDAGELQIWDNTMLDNPDPFEPIIFSPEIAGVNFVEEDIELTLSFEYVDSDKDGEKDDVKLGVWFNGKVYNDRWLYLENTANKLGGNLAIYCSRENSSLTIKTTLTPIDFAEYGYTSNWKVEMGITKKKK